MADKLNKFFVNSVVDVDINQSIGSSHMIYWKCAAKTSEVCLWDYERIFERSLSWGLEKTYGCPGSKSIETRDFIKISTD